MKKYLIALLAIFSLGQVAFIPNAAAQNPRVTIPDFADLVDYVVANDVAINYVIDYFY